MVQVLCTAVDDLVSSVTINLPQEVAVVAHAAISEGRIFGSDHEKMDFVLALTQLNIEAGGGPFGAAIFNEEDQLVVPGVNRVVADSAPVAHAEMVAIAAAGQALGTWDLRSTGHLSLVTSTEPCAMCLGAVPWSGVSSVVVGGRDDDARSAGFDEGHKPKEWMAYLESLGITVRRDVRRDAAAALLHRYTAGGGTIYNGGSASTSEPAGPRRTES